MELPSLVHDPRTWSLAHFVAFWAIHLLAIEVLQNGVRASPLAPRRPR